MSKELKKSRIVLSTEGQFSGLVEWFKYVYDADEVDVLLAEKDEEIRRLRRALYKACANWADVVAFEETEGIGYDNSVAERWRKMERKCLKKVEEH